MKKLFFILVAVMMAASMMAEGHMKFKGVEIDGTYDAFLSALTKHGCKTIQNLEGTSISRGNFAGVEMTFIPQTTSQTKKVYGVVASSDMQEEWGSLNAMFAEFKSLLIQKYGSYQYLQNKKEGYFIGDDYKLKLGNAQTALFFEADYGKIFLYMHRSANQETEAGTLVLWYTDNANYEIKVLETNLDL